MSNGDFHCVVLECEAEGYPEHGQVRRATVEIMLGPAMQDHVQGRTHLRIEDHAFDSRRMFYGSDILQFAEGLTRIHSHLEGSARLNDWDGERVLCLTVLDRRRGRIAVGGQFVPAVFWTEASSEDRFLPTPLFGSAGGIRIAFEGLITDQSCLPPVIAELRRFLTQAGISVQSAGNW